MGSLKCQEGCTCGRHYVRTEYHKQIAIQNLKKVPPQSAETRRKNALAQMGNQRARGIKHTPEQKAAHAARMKERWATGHFDKEYYGELTKQRWTNGSYDHCHPCWGKPGHHNGIRMRCINSEGVFAQQLDDAGIEWLYEPTRFKLSWCSYTPDFYLPEFDIWVEIKGYEDMPGKWPEKVKSFRQETGKTLIVIFQRELPTLTYRSR